MAAVKELLQVSRRLPLESGALRVALLFLALDTLGDSRRWTLGPLGALELDPQFASLPCDSENGRRSSSARGQLCAPDGFTVDIEIVLMTREDADGRLTLRADPTVSANPSDSSKLEAHRDELLIAAKAGLDELAEELLFFGTRQQTVS